MTARPANLNRETSQYAKKTAIRKVKYAGVDNNIGVARFSFLVSRLLGWPVRVNEKRETRNEERNSLLYSRCHEYRSDRDSRRCSDRDHKPARSAQRSGWRHRSGV